MADQTVYESVDLTVYSMASWMVVMLGERQVASMARYLDCSLAAERVDEKAES